VATPEGWLDLILFLIVAIVIGRLSALQLQRRREAELRGAEARAMFALSRDISLAASAVEAAPLLTARLAREAEMARVWIGLGPAIPEERVVADSSAGEARPATSSRWTLRSGESDAQPGWIKVRELKIARSRDGRDASSGGDLRRDTPRLNSDVEPVTVFRVPIVVGGQTLGSLWGTRRHGDPFPGRSHTRLLAAAADQIGQAVERDRLAAEATAAEVARQGDALKSAVLDSVSHDLRTPLSAIRASAGNLMDADVALTPDQVRASATSIDLEAQRLSRLVRNMLDLGRIEGGALHPSPELYDLADLVDPVIERLAPSIAPSVVEVSVPADLPAVQADGIFVDEILTNLLENAGRYASGRSIRVSAAAAGGVVRLTVEDAGPGVPASALPHLFERFYRVPPRKGSRSDGGSGIGLAVVKGLAEAMGGSVEAKASKLGGLAVTVSLPTEGGEPAASDEPTEGGEPAAEATE
jgi:K+-sensing histidine kinase KdpD